MKKWFVLSLALVTAAISQAVTVAWTVPNSEYDWALTPDGNDLSFSVFFVYSEYSETPNSALTAKQAYDYVTDKNNTTITNGERLINDGKNANLTYGIEDLSVNGNKIYIYGDSLGPGLNSDNKVEGSGYYYMVVINKSNEEEYAVAGTSRVIFTNGTSDTDGVYANNVGNTPNVSDYADMTWMGGTWRDALVPEPTVLALLAIGVAGVALRRKQNFLK